jgi:hypothetical protein
LRRAAFAPSLPRAVRVFFGKLAMVFFLLAAFAAFLMLVRAAAFCFELVMDLSLSFEKLHGALVTLGGSACLERSQVPPLARSGVFLSRVQSILTGF